MTKEFRPQKLELTRYLFFTGKGGVGKTSTACATAVSLADMGKKVLIVSTDPASNLNDVFETELGCRPIPVPGVNGLFGANLDPEAAAAEYREKVVSPYRGLLPDSAVASIEEQLSGACTVEIAAFDEFARLLAEPAVTEEFEHVIFDTAPTGHTLRLLQLPKAWSGFLDDSAHGASCLGPLSGLGDKKDLYARTLAALSDSKQTTLVLVSRPEYSALTEAQRASSQLRELGVDNQLLMINGMFIKASTDPAALALQQRQEKALQEMPSSLKNINTYHIPLVAQSLIGVYNLRSLFADEPNRKEIAGQIDYISDIPGLGSLVAELEQKEQGVVLTMGKGGVGKTTIAASIAISLVERGHRVHLSTTDPAAHLELTLGDGSKNEMLSVSRIDPKVETERYRQEILAQVSPSLDEDGLELLKEDLASPCTEEIAVFRAFAREVADAEGAFIVLDTAPTGHTLLLLDAALAYHREVQRATGDIPESVKRLLPKLRDPEYTQVILVTLPEATPVLEAARLQEDLTRAGIVPAWWVINQSWQSIDTVDPVLAGRAKAEYPWIKNVRDNLAKKTAMVPWQLEEPVGWDKLLNLGGQ